VKDFDRVGYVNMVSFISSPEDVRRHHAEYIGYYQATEADVELVEVSIPPPWDKAKCTYRLNVKTYLGWKVAQRHTGAFASIPEFEPAETA
jgi:hypothetical protein